MKNTIHRVLNLLLYLSLCFMAGTGLLMWLRLPPQQGRRHGSAPLRILGMDRHDWGDWHFYAAALFLAMIALHLAMNWAWLCRIAAGKGRLWRLWAGLALGGAILLFFALAPAT